MLFLLKSKNELGIEIFIFFLCKSVFIKAVKRDVIVYFCNRTHKYVFVECVKKNEKKTNGNAIDRIMLKKSRLYMFEMLIALSESIKDMYAVQW